MRCLIAALVLVSPSALAQEVHFAAGAGAGTAFGGLGMQLQLRGEHFAGFLSIGALGFLAGKIVATGEASSFGFGGGLRWYEGEVLFFSLNGTFASYSYHYDPGVRQSQVMNGNFSTLTVTIGARMRSGHAFFEAGAGGGFARNLDPGGTGSTGSPPAGTQAKASVFPIPDLSLAFGFEI
jgi:hypothetical protein